MQVGRMRHGSCNCWVFFLLGVQYACSFLSEVEYQSLKDIYYANGGEKWIWGSTSRYGPIWEFDDRADPCNDRNEVWQGLKCSADPSVCAVSTCSLKSVNLAGYNLTGQLPDSLGSLNKLTVLDLSQSFLIGSVPPSIGNLSEVTKLYIEYNSLQHSIPTDIGRITKLKALSFTSNFLTGEIPAELTLLTLLTSLYLSDNLFMGEIPLSIGNLQAIQYINVANNYLSGHIPESIGTMRTLIVFSANQNLLHGHIPSTLRGAVALESFEVYENALTGTLPPDMGYLPQLETLLLQYNSLSGQIPSELGQLSSIVELELQDNFFSRRIPSELANCSELQHLHLFGNRLTGPIPPEFGGLFNMVLLQAQGNKLTGNLKEFLRQADRMSLINIDLSDNLLTGQIPYQLFRLPLIETIALSSNCFTGTIPDDICHASQLTVLSMDGLAAADGCRGSRKKQKHHFPYVVALHTNTLDGTLPDCFMSHPNLTVAHFAGNGLAGTIRDIPWHSKLTNLSLSHNHLSGTIPLRLKDAAGMTELDLSFNKLTGDCSGILGGEPIENRSRIRLHLEVNRLSGVLPHVLSRAGKIDILVGNLFACDNIPRNDQNKEIYTCGSRQLDRALYSLVTACVLLCLMVLIGLVSIGRQCSSDSRIFLSVHSIKATILEGWRVVQSYGTAVSVLPDTYRNVKEFCTLLLRLTKILAKTLLVGFIMCLPLYVMKLVDMGRSDGRFSTRMHMYNWLLSTAYITGRIPAVILLCSWAGVVYILLVSIRSSADQDIVAAQNSDGSAETVTGVNRKEKALNYSQIAAVFVINAVIVFTANSFYVMTALDLIKVSNATEVIVQIALALFKYLYSVMVFPSFKQTAFINILALLFNSIFVPLLVTGVTSDSCYLGLFVNPDRIESTYHYNECEESIYTNFGSACMSYEPQYASVVPITPPFSYNYDCASVVLTIYTPVYLYGACVQLILQPLFHRLLIWCIDFSSMPEAIRSRLPGILWPSYWPTTDGIVRATELRDEATDMSKQARAADAPATGNISKKKDTHMINRDRIVSTMMYHLAIFVTFGLCNPYLAFAIALTVLVTSCDWVLLIGRFVHLRKLSSDALGGESVFVTRESEDSHADSAATGEYGVQEGSQTVVGVDISLLRLNDVLAHSELSLARCVWPLIWTSCAFYALICLDMAGDRVGWKGAIWVPFIAILVPVAVYINLRRRNNRLGGLNDNSPVDSMTWNEAELITIESSKNPVGGI